MRNPLARLALVSSVVVLGALGCKPEPTPECTTAADCSGASACVDVSCQAGACVKTNKPVGTPLADPTAGDCKTQVCDSNGEVKVAPLDTDLPDDSSECTENLCQNGVPTFPAKPVDTACGQGGQLRCNATGACVSCTEASQCPAGNACQTPTCVAGVCGFDAVALGTRVGTQTAGDCKVTQCNGQGALETVNDDADVPVDATACTQNVCTNGVPSNPPATAATACSEGNGTKCDGAGQCVECVMASDCPGFDTECNIRTCTAGVCGRSYPADGTLLTTQTTFDCKKSVCDGAGRIVVRNDDTDLPNDNNACTQDVCTAGVPSHTDTAAGASCGTSQVCDGAGACVGCNVAADCPGTDGVCGVRTCVNHVCGRNDVAANTPASTQTANDCKKVVCDGSGNAVTQNDDTDLPADDGNQCTSQTCVSGTPTFPTVTANTPCTQNGSFCNASGQCVQCNQASQCPGSDTECSTRTCVAGVCGRTGTAAGFVVTAQTSGDCQENRCAGDGGVVSVTFDSDVPADDGNPCTQQRCSSGTPSFPPEPIDTTCSGANGATRCNATGSCVQCTQASQCPGTDGECAVRTCSTSGACGFWFADAGVPVAAQTDGDCKQNQCSGDGGVVAAAFNTDVPADDGNECTQQSCSNGTPSFPAVTQGAQCTQGGSVCNGTQCVQCNAASDCPGSDTECAVRTCVNNVCGVNNLPTTTVLSQTAGNCQQRQCNGSGAVVSVANDTDLPVDGNPCTDDVCTAGVPSNPNSSEGSSCNGTSFCDGAGQCVQCTLASQCPGSDTDCQTRTCTNNACGFSYAASGTPTSSQTAGDCKRNECNGSGGVVAANFDDPQADAFECTDDVCTNGVNQHPPKTAGTACTQGGGSTCDGAGACVSCTADAQCSGGNACATPRCIIATGTCGFEYAAEGTVLASQTAGDCQEARCGANGTITSVADNADVPSDDGNECTLEQCTAGSPGTVFAVTDTPCGTNGTNFCSPTGTCVQCNQATQCAGSDTECQARTCSTNVCGMSYQPNGTLLASQTAGNCASAVCDGTGGTTSQTDAADLPVDGNDCTDDVCTGNVPSNPNKALNASCSSNGGTYCNGTGACVQCNSAGQCGTDNACTTYSCTANFCGSTSEPEGTVIATQTTGDCKQNQCASDGGIAVVNFNGDPLVDGNPCTDDLCASGTPSNPLLPAGSVCSVNGGDSCNMDGGCVLAPTVLAALPPDGGTTPVWANLVVTFSKAMLTSSVTVQSTTGACTGSLQVSQDDFVTCHALSAPTWTAGNTVATFSGALGLSFGGTFKVKVTTAAKEATGAPLRNEFVQAPGFTTALDAAPLTGLVISQVFTPGTSGGALYPQDWVELHNRGGSPVSLNGLSLQYASSSGSTWTARSLPNVTLQPGQFYLVQTSSATASTVNADTNLSGISMAQNQGKLVLANVTTALSGNCPAAANVVDYISWGSTNCAEGTVLPSPALNQSYQRRRDGCLDTNDNGTDFGVGTPVLRPSSTPASICMASVNEQGTNEMDYCVVQYPSSISVFTDGGIPTIYARVYESTYTEAPGANAGIVAQIGYGPATANAQWQSGWVWAAASFNAQYGNDDEYQLSLNMLDAGTYLYGARFSFDGVSWTYCDLDGAGANGGLTFEPTKLPVMTVTP